MVQRKACVAITGAMRTYQTAGMDIMTGSLTSTDYSEIRYWGGTEVGRLMRELGQACLDNSPIVMRVTSFQADDEKQVSSSHRKTCKVRPLMDHFRIVKTRNGRQATIRALSN
ncbi:hypothetical protein J6590_000417 [Homalodisca vitripennis]|nr:hypothetical protein J6590_000417 [Homalodisca vitripennis]